MHKRGHSRCVCVEGQKLLEQKERIYADMSAYQKIFAKVQLILNYNLNFNSDIISKLCRSRILEYYRFGLFVGKAVVFLQNMSCTVYIFVKLRHNVFFL